MTREENSMDGREYSHGARNVFVMFRLHPLEMHVLDIVEIVKYIFCALKITIFIYMKCEVNEMFRGLAAVIIILQLSYIKTNITLGDCPVHTEAFDVYYNIMS